MSSNLVLANFEPLEGIVTTETTLTLTRKSRRIVITNDHGDNNFFYIFNDSESFGTIGPTETLSLDFTTNQVIINGTNVPYRIWIYG